jgi:hypothetical protein
MNELLQYCDTERQAEIIQTVIDEGSNNKASFKLGNARQTVHEVHPKSPVRIWG